MAFQSRSSSDNGRSRWRLGGKYRRSAARRQALAGPSALIAGAPLSYENERLPGEVYAPIGVFDDPEPFEPEAYGWLPQRLEWLNIGDGLPRH